MRTSRVSLISFSTLVLTTLPIVYASVGDRSEAYQQCISSCIASQCDRDRSNPPPRDSPFSQYRPSPLWSCTSTCSYACQQSLTDLALSLSPSSPVPPSLQGLPLGRQVQFHGKWPFHRLDWSSLPFPLYLFDYLLPRVQEPLSVLFSIANWWAHYKGFTTLRQLSRSTGGGGGGGGARTTEGRNLARVYLFYALSGLNAWTGSTIFHTRDLEWTERLDYFSAGLTTLVGLWICIVRTRGWYTRPSTQESKRFKPLVSTVLTILYLAHVAYLSIRPRFDYAYNMKVNVFVTVVTIASWLSWCFTQSTLPSPSNFSRRQLSSYPSARSRFRAPHHLDPLLPLVALPGLSLLELFDFAPVGFGTGKRLLDAHALWHLSTVLVVRSWYRFLIRDVRWIDGQGDPPTAANAVQSEGEGNSTRSKDTPAIGRGGGGGFKGMEWRRGNLQEGMMDFGLGVLDRYNLGLGRGGNKTTTMTTPAKVSSDTLGGTGSRKD